MTKKIQTNLRHDISIFNNKKIYYNCMQSVFCKYKNEIILNSTFNRMIIGLS